MTDLAHRSPASRLAAISLAVSLGLAASAAVPLEADGPLSEEDVVRLFVAGTPEQEILERIRTSQVRFDDSEEMLRELRLAGLPEALVLAIQARARAATEDAGPDAPLPPGADDAARLVLVFPEPPSARRLALPLRLPADLGDRFGADLGGEPEIGALAIFVACLTQDHVPDQWRSRSPLGRDFLSMPRHRLLAFFEPQTPQAESDERVLEPPAALEIELEAGVAHDVMVGIAGDLAGAFRLLSDVELPALILTAGRTTRFRIGFEQTKGLPALTAEPVPDLPPAD